ncbi:hypothetical protein GCM10020331_048480 [Ectobacillus funiculus]
MSWHLDIFDGIHLGHQEVILTAKRIAEERGFKSAVMTFLSASVSCAGTGGGARRIDYSFEDEGGYHCKPRY